MKEMTEKLFSGKNFTCEHTALIHQNNNKSFYFNLLLPEQKSALLIGYAFIMFFSLVGNSLVLVAVYKNTNHRMRTVNNYFVANMSSSDLLITVCSVPKAINSVISDGIWPFDGSGGYHLCRMTKLLWFMTIDVSLLSLIAIAVNRFLLVFYPFKRLITPKIALFVIISIWLLSLIFAGSLIPGVGIRKVEFANTFKLYCSMKFWEDITLSIYLIFHFVVFIIWPLLTMVLLYSAIAIKIWCRKLPGNPSLSRHEFNDRLNQKVLVMLLTVVVLFSVCWVPFWVLITLPYNVQSVLDICFYITESIACANCALNPFVYAAFNEEFRKAFKKILQPFFVSCYAFGQMFPNNNKIFVFGVLTNNNVNLKNREVKTTSSAFVI